MMNKKILLSLACFALVVIGMNLALAESYKMVCVSRSNPINFGALCNPKMGIYTSGNFCVHFLDNGKECPTNINICNGLGLSCTVPSNGSVDGKAPAIFLLSPTPDEIFKSRSVPFMINLDEKGSIYYTDIDNGHGKWTAICQKCTSYSGKRSFTDGKSHLRIKVVDASGNENTTEITFFVDSKVPKIKKTAPLKGFANGNFYIDFTEENPASVVLNYGNSEAGYLTQNVDLSKCDNSSKNEYKCNVSVDLTNYNNQKIEYWFSVKDIANAEASYKKITLDVDKTLPVINNYNSLFTVSKNQVSFHFVITEANFLSINYIDNSDASPAEKKLCSMLKNGVCDTKKSFTKGAHDLLLKVYDKAGNVIATEINFTVS